MIKEISKIERSEFKALGTSIDIQIVVKNSGQALKTKNYLEKIFLYYQKFEKIFSRFDNLSELSKFNAQLGVFLSASTELRIVTQNSLKFYSETEGFFDPRIIRTLESIGYDRDFEKIDYSKKNDLKKITPFSRKLNEDLIVINGEICFNSRMDFSGIVKGYITDAVAKFLLKNGWQNFLVDSGGDMYFSGRDEEDNFWTIDIEGIPVDKILFKLSNRGIATSGISRRKWEKDNQRFHHLINPKKPEIFSFEVKSVTVIASNVEKADVFAKALFLMGKITAKKYARAKKISCVILDYRGNIWMSPMIKKYLC